MSTLTTSAPPLNVVSNYANVIRPIRTEEDYHRAMEVIDELYEVPTGTPEADILDVLIVLVSDYEQKTLPPRRYPSLPYAIQWAMKEKKLKQRDLVEMGLGDKTTVSRLVNGKRRPTLEQAGMLHKRLGIPADWILADLETQITGEA